MLGYRLWGISLTARSAQSVGTYTAGSSATYVDELGASWGSQGEEVMIVITQLDPVGGVIEGSFHVNVTQGGNATHSIEGTFHVCRLTNENIP